MDSECSFGEDHCGVVIELEAENAKLKEALRGCVEGYDKSMLYVADPDNPFTAAIAKARQVLGEGRREA